MPIYEYQCKKCGKKIEVIQKMSDKPLKKHEQCGGALTKLISAAGFQFKGTGWYVTDYARKSSGESKDTSTDKKTETKETSSNGSKESSGSGSTSAKAEGGKGKAEKSSSKSSSKKD
jgi:putative FmdB family regulatory protein